MENIEAMLCAYIEGDLDQSGRAEIEKHLLANPQHRKLIEELIATREMVRQLPRVSAPIDVGESLRGHVERSILLEDSTPAANARPMSIGRGRRMLAVAAIFVLVAGTGIVVVQRVLPGFKPPQAPQENIQAHLTPGTLPEERSRATRADADSTTADATAALRLHEALAPTPPFNNPVLPVTFDLAAIQRRLENSGYATTAGQADGVSPVYLVIQSPNPSMTNDKIARFLNSNGITFSPIPESILAANATTMPSMTDAIARGQELHTANAAPTAPKVANNYNNAGLQYDNNYAQQTNSQVNPGDLAAANENERRRQGAIITPANGAPTLDQTDREQGAASAMQNQIPPATQPAGDIGRMLVPSAADARVQDLYVARRMTHKQTDELRNALASQQDAPVMLYDQLALASDRDHAATMPSTQPAQVLSEMAFKPVDAGDDAGKKSPVTRDESKADAASTQPSDAPLVAGDLIEVRLANVDLPPGDKSVQNLTVADDGTIALPGIGPVRVVGSTLTQAQSAITKVYADAKLNVEPQPEVTVRKPQTVGMGGKPAEDAVDVVIVIQNAPPAQVISAPQIQAAPATQP